MRGWFRIAVASCGLGLLLVGCLDSGDDANCRNLSLIPPPSLEQVPETLVVDDLRLVLECFLWRDFMPISPPDGRPLMATIRLVELDSLPLPENLDLEHLWVLNGEQFWSTAFEDEPRPPLPPFEIERVARCGPKWGPGEVDVAVSVRHGSLEALYVKALGLPILRTE
jgi:hypothetical protein